MNKDSIKDYTNSLASDRKTTITQLINVIEQNIPKGFEKVMNYGMPSFVIPHSIYPNGYHCDTTLPLPFIGVSNQKSSISLHHMGLYANSELLNWFQSEYPKHSKTKKSMSQTKIIHIWSKSKGKSAPQAKIFVVLNIRNVIFNSFSFKSNTKS